MAIETAKQLGYLTRAVEDQGKQLEKVLELLRSQNEEAVVARAAVLRRIDDLSDRDDDLATRVSEVEKDLAPLKDLAAAAAAWRERWRGILIVAAVGVPIASAIATAVWDKIMVGLFGGGS